MTRLNSNLYSPEFANGKKTSNKRYSPSQKKIHVRYTKNFSPKSLLSGKDIIKANNLENLLNSSDDSMSSADVVDQASSYTDKSVEMKALNRSRKLIAKIDMALRRIKDGTYG